MTISRNPTPTRQPKSDDAKGRSGRVPTPGVDCRDRISGSQLWRAEVPGPQTPGLVSTTLLFAGVLLTLTPVLWAGPLSADGWTTASWNAALTGAAITALGLVRLTQPIRLAAATGIGCLLGGWLLLSPLFLDYGVAAQSVLVANIDIGVGTAVLLVSILGHRHAQSFLRLSDHADRSTPERAVRSRQ